MQKVIAGITQNRDGSYGLSGGLGTSIGAINVTVNTGGAPANGQQIAGEIDTYIRGRGRYYAA